MLPDCARDENFSAAAVTSGVVGASGREISGMYAQVDGQGENRDDSFEFRQKYMLALSSA